MHRQPDTVTLELFVARLRTFTEAEWASLDASVAQLRGDSVGALHRRAQLYAVPFGVVSPLLKVVGDALMMGALLLAEFSQSVEDAVGPQLIVHGGNLKDPSQRRHLELFLEVHDLAAAARPGDKIVADVLEWSMAALAYRRYLGEEVTREVFRYMEPVVPLATLTEPPADPSV